MQVQESVVVRRSRAWIRGVASHLAAAVVTVLAGCGGGVDSATTSPPVASVPIPLPLPLPEPGAPAAPAVPDTPVFTAADAPSKLSSWNQLRSDGRTLALRQGALPFSLNTPLFSNYAQKFRTLSVPNGAQVVYAAAGPLEFPVGSVLTKTFFYPRATASAPGFIGAVQSEPVDAGETVDLTVNQLIETRLMVREPTGRWGAVTYVWDADQKDATLVRSGQNIGIELVTAQGLRSTFTYEVPTDAQCATCHATNAAAGSLEPIGPQASNLNRDYAYATGSANQLDSLVERRMLSAYVAPAPRMAVWNDAQAASIDARARAYLDVNCASCHNGLGRSAGTGLWLGLQEASDTRLGICKPPVGGQQNGRFVYDIQPGDASRSFLYFRLSSYRMNSSPPRVSMPELGRHVFDLEGNALIREWIDGMTQTCEE